MEIIQNKPRLVVSIENKIYKFLDNYFDFTIKKYCYI